MKELLQALSAGGDVSLIALVFIMWRFDRRILRIELHIEQLFDGLKKLKNGEGG